MPFLGMDKGDFIALFSGLFGPTVLDTLKGGVHGKIDATLKQVFSYTPSDRHGQMIAFITRLRNDIARQNLLLRFEIAHKGSFGAENRLTDLLSLYYISFDHADLKIRERQRVDFFTRIGRYKVRDKADDEKFEQILYVMEDSFIPDAWKYAKGMAQDTGARWKIATSKGGVIFERLEKIRSGLAKWNAEQERVYLENQKDLADRQANRRWFGRHPVVCFLLGAIVVHLVVLFILMANQ